MELENILLQIQKREEELNLFDYKIDGISIYKLVRRKLIEEYVRCMGLYIMNTKIPVNKKNAAANTIKSIIQLIKLRLSSQTVSTVFVSFPRVDRVGEYYLDKFIDPLVSLCYDDSDDYIIMDQGHGGNHVKPRLHQKRSVQTDWSVVSAHYLAQIFHRRFYRLNKKIMDGFYKSVSTVYGASCPTKKELVRDVYSILRRVYFFESLFRHLKVKRLLGPARDFIRPSLIAAHRVGATVFELQHGVTYGETIMYGGFQPKEATPDFFLAFGDNDPIDVYGIDPKKIINIGWAFNDYIALCKDYVKYNEKDVLVISDPAITDSIINTVLFLAKDNPGSHFYVRPHPLERVSEAQQNRLDRVTNAHWQNNCINIAMVMQGFTYVIGENSTVLYEALAAGKKVGKLFFEGLSPCYLTENDKDCFWEIHNQESFSHFLNDNQSSKRRKSIYSPFNKKRFFEIINIMDNI